MLLLPPPTPTLAHPATLVSAPEQAEDGDLDVTGGSVAGGESPRTWQSRGRWARWLAASLLGLWHLCSDATGEIVCIKSDKTKHQQIKPLSRQTGNRVWIKIPSFLQLQASTMQVSEGHALDRKCFWGWGW